MGKASISGFETRGVAAGGGATQVAAIFTGSTAGIESALGRMQKQFGNTQRTIMGFMGAISFTVLISQVSDLAAQSVKFERVAAGFEALADRFDLAGDAVVRNIKEITQGQIATVHVMESVNKALTLLPPAAERMTELATIATGAAAALGLDVRRAFDDITTGIGRASPKILDNLGIIVNAREAYRAYSAEIGKSVTMLGAEEKQIALLNQVVDRNIERFGIIADQVRPDVFQQAGAAVTDLKIALGDLLVVDLRPILEGFRDFMETEGAIERVAKAILEVGQAIVALGAALLAMRMAASFQAALIPIRASREEMDALRQSIIATTGDIEMLQRSSRIAHGDIPGELIRPEMMFGEQTAEAQKEINELIKTRIRAMVVAKEWAHQYESLKEPIINATAALREQGLVVGNLMDDMAAANNVYLRAFAGHIRKVAEEQGEGTIAALKWVAAHSKMGGAQALATEILEKFEAAVNNVNTGIKFANRAVKEHTKAQGEADEAYKAMNETAGAAITLAKKELLAQKDLLKTKLAARAASVRQGMATAGVTIAMWLFISAMHAANKRLSDARKGSEDLKESFKELRESLIKLNIVTEQFRAGEALFGAVTRERAENIQLLVAQLEDYLKENEKFVEGNKEAQEALRKVYAAVREAKWDESVRAMRAAGLELERFKLQTELAKLEAKGFVESLYRFAKFMGDVFGTMLQGVVAAIAELLWFLTVVVGGGFAQLLDWFGLVEDGFNRVMAWADRWMLFLAGWTEGQAGFEFYGKHMEAIGKRHNELIREFKKGAKELFDLRKETEEYEDTLESLAATLKRTDKNFKDYGEGFWALSTQVYHAMFIIKEKVEEGMIGLEGYGKVLTEAFEGYVEGFDAINKRIEAGETVDIVEEQVELAGKAYKKMVSSLVEIDKALENNARELEVQRNKWELYGSSVEGVTTGLEETIAGLEKARKALLFLRPILLIITSLFQTISKAPPKGAGKAVFEPIKKAAEAYRELLREIKAFKKEAEIGLKTFFEKERAELQAHVDFYLDTWKEYWRIQTEEGKKGAQDAERYMNKILSSLDLTAEGFEAMAISAVDALKDIEDALENFNKAYETALDTIESRGNLLEAMGFPSTAVEMGKLKETIKLTAQDLADITDLLSIKVPEELALETSLSREQLQKEKETKEEILKIDKESLRNMQIAQQTAAFRNAIEKTYSLILEEEKKLKDSLSAALDIEIRKMTAAGATRMQQLEYERAELEKILSVMVEWREKILERYGGFLSQEVINQINDVIQKLREAFEAIDIEIDIEDVNVGTALDKFKEDLRISVEDALRTALQTIAESLISGDVGAAIQAVMTYIGQRINAQILASSAKAQAAAGEQGATAAAAATGQWWMMGVAVLASVLGGIFGGRGKQAIELAQPIDVVVINPISIKTPATTRALLASGGTIFSSGYLDLIKRGGTPRP